MQHMRSTNEALEARSGRPLRREVTAHRVIDVPYDDAERAVHICLDDLIERAFPLSHPTEYGSAAAITMRGGQRWLRIPVTFEIETARSRPGQIAHLRWRARRYRRFFPVMEADVLLRLTGSPGTELVVEGIYEPPFGLLGALGDVLVGRIASRSTLDAFVDGLGEAIQVALTEGRCARATATRVRSGVA